MYAPNCLPLLGYVKDTDDASAMTTISEYEQYETYKEHRLDKVIKKIMYPKPTVALYKGAIGTAYGTPKGKTWIDMSNPDVEHYGCKWYISFPSASFSGTGQRMGNLRIMTKFFFECRDVR